MGEDIFVTEGAIFVTDERANYLNKVYILVNTNTSYNMKFVVYLTTTHDLKLTPPSQTQVMLQTNSN